MPIYDNLIVANGEKLKTKVLVSTQLVLGNKQINDYFYIVNTPLKHMLFGLDVYMKFYQNGKPDSVQKG